MADKKPLQLPELTSLTGNEFLHVTNNVGDYKLLVSQAADLLPSVSVTKESVGLGNVDDVSDLNRPISSLEQQALDTKISTSVLLTEVAKKALVDHTHTVNQVTGLQATLDLYIETTDLSSKANTYHLHDKEDVNDIDSELALLSDIDHTHSFGDTSNKIFLISQAAEFRSMVAGNTIKFTLGNDDLMTYYSLVPIRGSATFNYLDEYGTPGNLPIEVVYTAPLTEGPGGFIINERQIDINIIKPEVVAPNITNPVNGSTISAASFTMAFDSFSVIGATDTYNVTEIQIATDAGFANIVQSLSGSYPTWSLAITGLSFGATYYVRARHAGSLYGWSAWGNTNTFTTTIPSWVERSLFSASDRADGNYFGYSVSVSGDGTRCIAGAYTATPSGIANAGKAYVFTRSGITWTQETILTASDKASVDNFGMSVAISNDSTRCVIGAYMANSSGISNAGKAYIFLRTGTTWTEEAILIASVNVANDYFSNSVFMDATGTRCVIGAIGADPSGRAYIFLRTGTTWTQEAILVPSDGGANDQFGVSVSMTGDGTRCIIGAYQAIASSISNAGKAYIFSRTGTVWTQEAIMTASDKAANNYFGLSVTISKDATRCAVAAWRATVSGILNVGKVYIFVRSGTTWSQEDILTPDIFRAGDQFGNFLSMSADGFKCFIAASNADENTPWVVNTGKVFIYSRQLTTSWGKEATLEASDIKLNSYFGTSVSATDDGLSCVIGAYQADPGGVSSAGQSYYFTME
jgi:hypothetical protein